MAVEDKYVDADIEAGKLGSALFAYGTDGVFSRAVVAIAAADDDGSVFRCFAGVPSSLVPVQITIQNTAITAGTDFDLGLYKVNSGAVVEIDILSATNDLSSAVAYSVVNNVGLKDVPIASTKQTLGELSAQTDIDSAYDIALTGNTVGSAAGTIVVTAWFAYK